MTSYSCRVSELLPRLLELFGQPLNRHLDVGDVVLMCVRLRLGFGTFGLGVLVFGARGAGCEIGVALA
ncbi:hypothetical protein OG809_17235 [Kribbella soli]